MPVRGLRPGLAVYAPASRRCTLACGGHLPPAAVTPDGPIDFLRVAPGPPRGVGGLPFEATGAQLLEGSLLVLYTDGLFCTPTDWSKPARCHRPCATHNHPGRLKLEGQLLVRPQRPPTRCHSAAHSSRRRRSRRPRTSCALPIAALPTPITASVPAQVAWNCASAGLSGFDVNRPCRSVHTVAGLPSRCRGAPWSDRCGRSHPARSTARWPTYGHRRRTALTALPSRPGLRHRRSRPGCRRRPTRRGTGPER
ncbi:SpoIIE family protein phosphatase [Streptomyces sp. NPDC001530]|uniref:SpoIIE family protein phosphatase n=1 Tax=Streptomyces sp. NPDC001530 TaxID=3364582 RepID=UPI00367EFF66